jgi:hypothetical protein
MFKSLRFAVRSMTAIVDVVILLSPTHCSYTPTTEYYELQIVQNVAQF